MSEPALKVSKSCKPKKKDKIVKKKIIEVDSSIEPINKINLSECLKLYFRNGVEQYILADKYGVSNQAINQALKPYKEILLEANDLDAYRDNKNDIFDSLMFKMMQEMIDTGRLKGASINNIAYTFTQLNNARLTELGKLPIEAHNLTFNVVYNDNRSVNVGKDTPKVIDVGDTTDTDE